MTDRQQERSERHTLLATHDVCIDGEWRECLDPPSLTERFSSPPECGSLPDFELYRTTRGTFYGSALGHAAEAQTIEEVCDRLRMCLSITAPDKKRVERTPHEEWVARGYKDPIKSSRIDVLCDRVATLTEQGPVRIEIFRLHPPMTRTTSLATTVVREVTADLRSAFETFATPEMEGLQISIELEDIDE